MKKEKIIKVKPKNVYEICRFLDETYFHVGYGGGLTTITKMYSEGISFRSTDKCFYLKNPPVKYEIIIQNRENFSKEEINKLEKLSRN